MGVDWFLVAYTGTSVKSIPGFNLNPSLSGFFFFFFIPPLLFLAPSEGSDIVLQQCINTFTVRHKDIYAHLFLLVQAANMPCAQTRTIHLKVPGADFNYGIYAFSRGRVCTLNY